MANRIRKATACIMGTALVLGLAGCMSQPSEDEVRAAIDAGTLNARDAVEQGLVDQEWVDRNYPAAPAATKGSAAGSFKTTYLDGSPADSSVVAGNQLVVLIDTSQPEAQEAVGQVEKAYGKLSDLGISVVGFVLDKNLDTARANLADATFPLLVCNDEVRTALGIGGAANKTQENAPESTAVMAVFTKELNGEIKLYTSWVINPQANDLVDSAQNLLGVLPASPQDSSAANADGQTGDQGKDATEANDEPGATAPDNGQAQGTAAMGAM